MCDSELDLFAIKILLRQLVKLERWKISILDVSMLASQFHCFCCDNVGECSLRNAR